MVRAGRMLALGAWVVGLSALLAGLVAMGDGALAAPPLREPGSWGGWLAVRSAPEAAMAVVRLVGIALAGYLLVATLLAVVVRVGGTAQAVSVADLVTLPAVRGMVQAALGLGFAGAAVAAVGAGGAVDPTPTAAEVALVSAGAADEAPTLEPLGASVDASDASAPILQPLGPSTGPDPVAPVAPAVSGGPWTVAAGDHLWSIAVRVVEQAWGRAPSDAEVAPFWEVLLEANRAGLADPSNPDLLFPGQVLHVPAPPPPA